MWNWRLFASASLSLSRVNNSKEIKEQGELLRSKYIVYRRERETHFFLRHRAEGKGGGAKAISNTYSLAERECEVANLDTLSRSPSLIENTQGTQHSISQSAYMCVWREKFDFIWRYFIIF